MVALLSKIGYDMVVSLLTEAFVRKVMVRILEAGAKKSKWETDDKMVADLKEQWKIED
jgi:hypothetical protein